MSQTKRRPWTPGPWHATYVGSSDWEVWGAETAEAIATGIHDYKRSLFDHDLIALAPELAEAVLAYDEAYYRVDMEAAEARLCELAEMLRRIGADDE